MITIEPMQAAQAPILLDIYRQGILSGMATFETTVPEWPVFDTKYLPHSRIVALEEGELTGWAALSPVSSRDCYSGVAEVSVYVAENWRGKGIGKQLLKELAKLSEENNFWTLESRIFSENLASIKIHEENGFRIVGSRERIGQLNGIWRDTLLLERRSIKVGI